MSGGKCTGRAVVVGEYSGADSTIILNIDQRVDIVKKSEKWWYVSDGSVKGYYPAICLRELDPCELPALPEGWNKTTSSDGRVYYYNERTGKSQWDYPKVDKPPPPPPPKTPAPHGDGATSASHSLHIRAFSDTAVSIKTGSEHYNDSPSAGSKLTPPPLLSVRPRHTPSSSMDDIPAPRTPVGSFRAPNALAEQIEAEETALAQSFLLSEENEDAPAAHAMEAHLRAVPEEPLPGDLKEDIERFSINGFAEQFFNSHKKWTLFRGRQKLKPEELLSFSRGGLRQSLTRLSKNSESFAIKLFPKILAVIENEKRRGAAKGAYEESFTDILTSVEAQFRSDHSVIDEVFCQIVKECTNNPSVESTARGWALLYACMICFTPSRDLGKYIYKLSRPLRQEKNAIGGFSICVNKLILQQLQGSSRLPDKIPAGEVSIKQHIEPIMQYHIPEALYGCPLECLALWETVQLVADGMGEDIRGSTMSLLGRDTLCSSNVEIGDQLPTLAEVLATENPPGLLVLLCDAVVQLRAGEKRGIFREAANVESVKGFIEKLEMGNLDCLLFVKDPSNEDAIVSAEVVSDVLVACDLLKIWFRRLPEPIVPYRFYDECVKAGQRGNVEMANDILNRMPALYRASLAYLCSFIKYLSQFSAVTMMEVSNLCLVFAPNCIKNPSDDLSAVVMNAESEKRCLQLFVNILGGDGAIWPPA